MKLILTPRKPRNPFVAAGLQRRAGAHRRSAASERQAAQRSLRQDIERLRPSP